jgi:hypothetical protein
VWVVEVGVVMKNTLNHYIASSHRFAIGIPARNIKDC